MIAGAGTQHLIQLSCGADRGTKLDGVSSQKDLDWGLTILNKAEVRQHDHSH